MNVVRVKQHFIKIKPSKSKATILSGNPERFSRHKNQKFHQISCHPRDRVSRGQQGDQEAQ